MDEQQNNDMFFTSTGGAQQGAPFSPQFQAQAQHYEPDGDSGRFMKSLGYTDQTEQSGEVGFQVQVQHYEEGGGKDRFMRSIGYSDPNALVNATQFRAQTGAPQDAVIDERMQRSMNYSGTAMYPPYAADAQVQDKIDLTKQEPVNAVPQMAAPPEPMSYAAPNAAYETKNSAGEPVNYGEAELTAAAVAAAGAAVANKSRRAFKKTIHALIKTAKMLCLCSPLIVMVMYAKPLALISYETHRLMFFASVALIPILELCSTLLDKAIYKIKTDGSVVTIEEGKRLKNRGGEVTVEKCYKTGVRYFVNGMAYTTTLKLDREPQIGQSIKLMADPRDITDAMQPENALKRVLLTIGQTVSLAIVVYVILNWEAGKVQNWNNGDEMDF